MKKREVVTSPDKYMGLLRNKVKKIQQRDKQEELESLCSELAENTSVSRVVFQTIKNLTKSLKLCTVAIKDNVGKKLTEVSNRWKEHCEVL